MEATAQQFCSIVWEEALAHFPFLAKYRWACTYNHRRIVLLLLLLLLSCCCCCCVVPTAYLLPTCCPPATDTAAPPLWMTLLLPCRDEFFSELGKVLCYAGGIATLISRTKNCAVKLHLDTKDGGCTLSHTHALRAASCSVPAYRRGTPCDCFARGRSVTTSGTAVLCCHAVVQLQH